MYCINCGEKLGENDAFCSKCGNKIREKVEYKEQVSMPKVETKVESSTVKSSSGTATASLVLGIIGISLGVILFLSFMGYYVYTMEVNRSSYYNYIYDYSSKQNTLFISAIGTMLLPGILSLIGLPLGIFSKIKSNKGSKIAGIVLNAITLILCVIPFILTFTI